MHTHRLTIILLIILAPTLARAQAVGEVVQVQVSTGTTVVGECLEVTDEGLRLFILRTRSEMHLSASSISTHKPLASDKEILGAVGLFPYLTWKAEKCLTGIVDGRVAEITASQIYVATNDARGTRRGDRLAVFRLGTEIVDPESRQVVGRQRMRVCELEVTTVADRLITARIVPESGGDPVVGDVVIDTMDERPLAILPLAGQTEAAVDAGKELQIKLTSLLGDAGFRIVERSSLDQALAELALQQSAAFDPATAQRIGDLVGAYAVLIGDVLPLDQRAEIHVRLVHVRTGEVLATAVGTVANRDLAAFTTVVSARKESLREKVVGSKWRWSGDPKGGVFTYHANGTVTCTNWYGPGTWRVVDSRTIFQIDHNESNRWRITFNDPMTVATWVHVRSGKIVTCPVER